MLLKALALHEELGTKEGTATASGNLCGVYAIQGKSERAEAMCHKALALNAEIGRKHGMAENYLNLGILYQHQGNLEQARTAFRKSLAFSKEVNAVSQAKQAQKLLDSLSLQQ